VAKAIVLTLDKVKVVEVDIKTKIRTKGVVVDISIISNIIRNFKPTFQEPKTTRALKVLLKLFPNWLKSINN
jgi:hypothetical protein